MGSPFYYLYKIYLFLIGHNKFLLIAWLWTFLIPSHAVTDLGVPSRTSKWCSDAMVSVQDMPKSVKPLMIFLCTLHAGGVKTYEDVGFCMDTVKLLCLHECEASDDDMEYRACVFDADVVAAYQICEQRFLECIGADQQCIRLQSEWKVGEGCWQKCYKRNFGQCLQGCKPVMDASPEASTYLHCAMKMNPAHETFRVCLLQRIPIIPNMPNIPTVPPRKYIEVAVDPEQDENTKS